jgi:hypothetical protein
MDRLEHAMETYAGLIEEARSGGIDDATLSKRALRIGLIVRETDAWLLDLPSGRWFRYDGFAVTPLGGWDKTGDGAKTTEPAQAATEGA